MKKLLLLFVLISTFGFSQTTIPTKSVSIVIASTTATANLTSSAFGSEYFNFVSFQLVCTSLNAADGVIKLQDSNDGTNYNDISGATITVASGTSSNMIRYTAYTGRYLKAVWTKGSNTAGTMVGTVVLKK